MPEAEGKAMSPDDPIPLREACREILGGRWTPSTLRAEAARGNLVIFRIGRVDCTTPAELAAFKVKAFHYKRDAIGRGIYVVGFDHYVKIGWSMEMEERITFLQSCLPVELAIYGAFEGTQAEERRLHRRFGEYRLRGEWFNRRDELAAWIDAGCKR